MTDEQPPSKPYRSRAFDCLEHRAYAPCGECIVQRYRVEEPLRRARVEAELQAASLRADRSALWRDLARAARAVAFYCAAFVLSCAVWQWCHKPACTIIIQGAP